MQIQKLHDFDLSFPEATRVQKNLSHQIRCTHIDIASIETVAGVDVSFNKWDPTLFGAVVVMRLADFQILEMQTAICKVNFPYVSGFLGFREVPVLFEAFQKLNSAPDAVICDGQGLAHPRFFGLACHLGLMLEVPTLGCAKSRLVGEYKEPSVKRGASCFLYHQEKMVGRVVRTKNHVKPVFVSPGHLIDITSATQLVLKCTTNYRLPEPIRKAHQAVNELRLRHKKHAASHLITLKRM